MNPAAPTPRNVARWLILLLVLGVRERSALAQQPPEAPTTTPVPRASAPVAATKERLTLPERMEVFEKVWKEIHDHYYDPSYNGVDWNEVRRRYAPLVLAAQGDQEFYSLMSQMTSELHDAHTRFSSPQQWRNFRRQQGVTVGFSVDDVEGKTAVT